MKKYSPVNRKNARGFNVIAMLLVIAVIGVIATIAVPHFGKVKNAQVGDRTMNVGHISTNEIDRALAQLPIGQAVFNSPRTMYLGETRSIRLLLSLNHTIEELTRELRSLDNVEGGKVAIADRIEARLTGQGFSILAVTPETQAIALKQHTEWQWEVQPKAAGRQQLHLTLSTVVKVQGTNTPRLLRTFDRTIDVSVDWTNQIQTFFFSNWQWLWATIVAPGALWLWHYRRKRKQPKKPKPAGKR